MTRLAALACLVAACGGGDAAAPDAAAAAPAPACSAVFRDNFAETWTGPADCAAAEVGADGGHTTLALAIPSRTLGVEFAIAIDLGPAPAPGTYSASSLTTPWTAMARRDFEMTACVYHAGTDAIPMGTFTLALDSVGAHPHGRLDLALYVLSRPYTYCGETTTEQLTVTF